MEKILRIIMCIAIACWVSSSITMLHRYYNKHNRRLTRLFITDIIRYVLILMQIMILYQSARIYLHL